MTDPSTSRTLDEVAQADYVEQQTPAYPDADDDTTYGSAERDLAAVVDRDAFDANPADIVEQSIAVPLDDDRDAEPGY
ncbi:hypothetical protein [Nocardia sp. NPDC052112]|uniref:hypothetical protein n=1 Tax=Nocardia sp. NPDC052112 TaxID=3155646 RepID=UPI00342E364D